MILVQLIKHVLSQRRGRFLLVVLVAVHKLWKKKEPIQPHCDLVLDNKVTDSGLHEWAGFPQVCQYWT